MRLRDEVHGNPACAAALAAKDCAELARIVSIGRTRRTLADLADVQAALQRTGVWWAIKGVAAQPDHPANAAAVAVMDVANARYARLDVELPLVQQMFGALVQCGVMPVTLLEEITALAIVPDPVNADQIAREVFNPDGTEKE